MRSKVKINPSMFLRIFLSHLFLLLAFCIASLLAYRYMFSPGVHLFVIRRPHLLVPIVLGLIGIAGLLSVWTAAVIGTPLEVLASTLKSENPVGNLFSFRNPTNVSEIDDVLASLKHALNKFPSAVAVQIASLKELHSPNVMIVQIDSERSVVMTNRLAAERAGVLSESDARPSLQAFASGASWEPFAAALHAMIEEEKPVLDVVTSMMTPTGRAVGIRWNSLAQYNAQGEIRTWKLYGIDV